MGYFDRHILLWGHLQIEQNEPKILGGVGNGAPISKYDTGSSLGNSPRPHITTTFTLCSLFIYLLNFVYFTISIQFHVKYTEISYFQHFVGQTSCDLLFNR